VLRPQVVVLFGFFVAFGTVLIVRAVLFIYFPSFVKSCCPFLARFTQETKVAKGLPNYFDAMPTNILRDKLTTAVHVKDSLRTKYAEALARREEALAANDKADSPRKSPRRRNRRTISAAEQYLDQRWIVGCPSYGRRSPVLFSSLVWSLVTQVPIVFWLSRSDSRQQRVRR
jgi:hypothetical protein